MLSWAARDVAREWLVLRSWVARDAVIRLRLSSAMDTANSVSWVMYFLGQSCTEIWGEEHAVETRRKLYKRVAFATLSRASNTNLRTYALCKCVFRLVWDT
ncbi:hypothetical protein U1Q18_035203 [Sarracenia purpurea var. burkii]